MAEIEGSCMDYEKLSNDRLGESSAAIRERAQAARELQRVRFEGKGILCPVQGPGLSSRAGTGTIVPCGNRDYRNSDVRVLNVRKFYNFDEVGRVCARGD
jgi:hypothetical protein